MCNSSSKGGAMPLAYMLVQWFTELLILLTIDLDEEGLR